MVQNQRTFSAKGGRKEDKNMKNYVSIYGKSFELVKPRDKQSYIEMARTIKIRSLSDCYNEPSRYKQAIYDEWEEWLDCIENHCGIVLRFGVRSHNYAHFTLHAEIEIDGQLYYMLVTPSRNILYLI